MVELILLLTLSVITARLLEKRYKVASVAHAIFFIFISMVYLLTTDLALIKEAMINWMGEKLYESINSALSTPVVIMNIGISAVLVFEVAIFILVPILSIAAFIQKVKDDAKEIDIKCPYLKLFGFFKKDLYPSKDFRYNKLETYLILGKLLN